MGVELVTGHAGKAHITSEQVGALNAGLVGLNSYVLPTGDKCACTRVGGNKVSIAPGDVVCQGRQVHITSTEVLPIANGTQGQKRVDFVGIDYVKEPSNGREIVELIVVKGKPGYRAKDPSYDKGSILDGAHHVFCPMWRIPINGIDIGTPTRVAEELVPMSEMHRMILGRVKNESISDWTVSATEDAIDRPGLRLMKKDGTREYLLIFSTDGKAKKIQMWDCIADKSIWSFN